MRSLFVLALISSSFALSACTQGGGGMSATGASTEGLYDPFIDGRHCEEEDGVSWESFGQGFLLDHCTGCHSEMLTVDQRAGAPLGVNFESKEFAEMWLDRIYARAADDNDTMPPVDSVPDFERVLLGDWLACGAP